METTVESYRDEKEIETVAYVLCECPAKQKRRLLALQVLIGAGPGWRGTETTTEIYQKLWMILRSDIRLEGTAMSWSGAVNLGSLTYCRKLRALVLSHTARRIIINHTLYAER